METDAPLHERIFTGRYERRVVRWYRRVFSIVEIESTTALQWFLGATLLSFLATFQSWIGSSALTIQNYEAARHVCWPWFPDCGAYYWFEALPHGYSQSMFYMVLMGVGLMVVYFMYKRDWVLAHFGLMTLFAWKCLAGFVLSQQFFGNYDYYHLVFTFILLFLPLKLFFLKFTFVLFYTLSATTKIHETWVLGTYFSALQTGLPIFPDWSIPIWTNLVMLMQIVGAWFLLSGHRVLQRLTLIFFILFHFYSGILVEYRYPLTVLPSLIILFGLFYEPVRVPLTRRALWGWGLVVVMIGLQFVSIIIPGDQRLTLEGNRYGMYMFEANHQCISHATLRFEDGREETVERQTAVARHRCDPYRYWFQLQQLCGRYGELLTTVEWTFDHSINGGPFYRIVDTSNACALPYHPFTHNEWIKEPPEARVIGYPVKNVYH